MQRTGKVVVSGSGRQIGLTCIAILLLSVFCFGQTPSSHPTSDDTPTTHVPTTWREFHRHNMERFNPYENILSVSNVGSLGLKWSYKTGDTVWSSPAVTGGVVYVGSLDDNVYALDARTGAKLWSFTAGNSVQTSPAVANGVVYAGSWDDNVYALDANTGALLWIYATGDHVLSSPTVAKGVVYVGSWDDNVYALDARTGAACGATAPTGW